MLHLLLVSSTALNLGGLGDLLSGKKNFAPPVVMGDESIMSQKVRPCAHPHTTPPSLISGS